MDYRALASQIAQQGALGQGAAGLAGVGQMQQGLQAADLAGQYGEFMRQYEDPYKKLGALTGASAAAPVGTTTTESYKPGLFDYIKAGAQAASG